MHMHMHMHAYADSRQDFSTSQTIPFPFFKTKMGPQMKPMGSEKCPFFVNKLTLHIFGMSLHKKGCFLKFGRLQF